MKSLDITSVDRLLCLGAHSDDVEIGAGGTVLELLDRKPDVHVDWVVFAAAVEQRAEEARASAARFLAKAKSYDVHVFSYRDGFLPFHAADVKDEFEGLKSKVDPDLILTHHHDDRHQDHRLVSELTWNTWRDHAILEYEIIKWDGDLSRPNVYVPVRNELQDEKIAILLDVFASQRGKDWFDEETYRSLARIRGLECRSPSRYAEAFHARKLVLGF